MALFFLIGLLVCVLCMGVCIGLLIALYALSHAGRAADDPPPANRSRTLSDEEWREFRRRQRELQNFFNYTGDVMPPEEDE